MDNFWKWSRKNWLLFVVLAVVLGVLSSYSQNKSVTMPMGVSRDSGLAVDGISGKGVAAVPMMQEVAPSEVSDRLIIKSTTLSLLVKSVDETTQQIENLAKRQGGFFVEANLNKPEEKETGSITIRIPTEKLQETLSEIKKMGVRVVSETVIGEDVTDQYVDVQARLTTLEKGKQKLESLLDQANNVTDILNVQRELNNLQYQIDQLKGQQKYLEESSKLSRISVYLSTDELALPYAPDEAWRPGVILKQAVRSLVRSSRSGVNVLIWLGVYAPLWLPLVLIVWWFRRKK